MAASLKDKIKEILENGSISMDKLRHALRTSGEKGTSRENVRQAIDELGDQVITTIIPKGASRTGKTIIIYSMKE